MDHLRYPIGSYTPPDRITPGDITRWIAQIEALPTLLADAIDGVSEQQLDTRYRPEGWTLRQVVHHVAHITSHRGRTDF